MRDLAKYTPVNNRISFVAKDMPPIDRDDIIGWLQWAIFITDPATRRFGFLVGLLNAKMKYRALTERQCESLAATIGDMLAEIGGKMT